MYNFQAENLQPQGVAQLLLDFLSISAWLLLIKMLLIRKVCIYQCQNVRFKKNKTNSAEFYLMRQYEYVPKTWAMQGKK